MEKIKTGCDRFCLLLPFLLSTSLYAMQEPIRDEKIEEYAVDGLQELIVNNDLGSIELSSWDRNMIQITTIKKPRRPQYLKHLKSYISRKKNMLEVRGIIDQMNIRGDAGIRRCVLPGNFMVSQSVVCVGNSSYVNGSKIIADVGSIDYSIIIPFIALKLLIRTNGDNIRVTNVYGSLNAKNSQGDIIIKRILQPVFARTSQGRVKIKDATSNVEANSNQGEVTASHIGGDIVAESSQGRVGINNVTGSVNATSAQGAVAVTNAGSRVNARSAQGSIYVHQKNGADGDVEAWSAQGGIKIRNLAGNLKASTSMGDISYRRNPRNTNGSINTHCAMGSVRGDK